MARRSSQGRNRGGGHADHRAMNRTARVGELIRRIVAEALDDLDDERLAMVSITGVDVDRDLHRAVVWFTALDGDDDPEIMDAFDEHRGRLRRAVGDQTRLRKTPDLQFRADVTLRSAERIEALLEDVTDDNGDDSDAGGPE